MTEFARPDMDALLARAARSVLRLRALAAIAALQAFCNGLQHLNWGHC